MQGLHIKVLVAFRGEGQGFDWAVLLNWAQQGPIYWLQPLHVRQNAVTHTASVMKRQLQLTCYS